MYLHTFTTMGRLSGHRLFVTEKKSNSRNFFINIQFNANSNNEPGGYLPDLIKNKHSRQIIREPPLAGGGVVE